MGLVIGKRGSNLQHIKETFNLKTVFVGSTTGLVRIHGNDPANVESARNTLTIREVAISLPSPPKSRMFTELREKSGVISVVWKDHRLVITGIESKVALARVLLETQLTYEAKFCEFRGQPSDLPKQLSAVQRAYDALETFRARSANRVDSGRRNAGNSPASIADVGQTKGLSTLPMEQTGEKDVDPSEHMSAAENTSEEASEGVENSRANDEVFVDENEAGTEEEEGDESEGQGEIEKEQVEKEQVEDEGKGKENESNSVQPPPVPAKESAEEVYQRKLQEMERRFAQRRMRRSAEAAEENGEQTSTGRGISPLKEQLANNNDEQAAAVKV